MMIKTLERISVYAENAVRDVLSINSKTEIDYDAPLSKYGLDESGYLFTIFDKINNGRINNYISGGSLNKNGIDLFKNAAEQIGAEGKFKQKDRINSIASRDNTRIVNEITLSDIIEIINYEVGHPLEAVA